MHLPAQSNELRKTRAGTDVALRAMHLAMAALFLSAFLLLLS